MLTKLDDTLRHQLVTTFDHVGSSDHRFFDRYAFLIYDPAGEVALMSGMGLYSNMNVLDGFACLMHEGRQHNLRVSRELRPDIDSTAIGPLQYEVVEPLQRFRLVVEPGSHGFAFDLTWEGMLPPHEETPHFSRVNGRPAQDYRRFDQVGSARGSVELDGRTFEAERWWSIRDHSWGVRPGVGGFEPYNGPAPGLLTGDGGLFFWMSFLTDDGTGYLQIHEDSTGRRLLFDGHLRLRGGDGDVQHIDVIDAEHELDFYEDTRVLRSMRVTIRPAAGTAFTIEGHRLFGAPWAFVGSGYDNGFDDGKGLGAYRGAYVEESDIYGVSHPELVVLPNGEEVRPLHREGPFNLTVDGRQGWAHVTIVPVGRYKPAGF